MIYYTLFSVDIAKYILKKKKKLNVTILFKETLHFIKKKKKVKYGRTSFLNLIRSEGGGTSSFNDWWEALLY